MPGPMDPRNMGQNIAGAIPGVQQGLDGLQWMGQNVVDPAQQQLQQLLQMLGMAQQPQMGAPGPGQIQGGGLKRQMTMPSHPPGATPPIKPY